MLKEKPLCPNCNKFYLEVLSDSVEDEIGRAVFHVLKCPYCKFKKLPDKEQLKEIESNMKIAEERIKNRFSFIFDR